MLTRKTIEKDEKYLRQISKPVDFTDPEKTYQADIEKLEKFCLENECFALAAVQIGIPKRIIYLKNTTLDIPLDDKTYNEAKVLINPTIISKKGETKYWEACLSCLDYAGLVKRPYEIKLEYYDENGDKRQETFKGFETTVLSHELDHLDGILHMDIAEKVLELKKEQRQSLREKEPYQVISKTSKFNR